MFACIDAETSLRSLRLYIHVSADQPFWQKRHPAALSVLLAPFDGSRGRFGADHQESVHLPHPQTVHQVKTFQNIQPHKECLQTVRLADSSNLLLGRVQKPLVRHSRSTSLCLFFRRDYESRPVKLRLLAEIRAYPHRKEPDWVPEPNAPIDYCYVRPNHIPSVNAMCHDSFWPGSTDALL